MDKNIDFVTFYIPINTKILDSSNIFLKGVISNYLKKFLTNEVSQFELITYMFYSCRLFHKNCNNLILTNNNEIENYFHIDRNINVIKNVISNEIMLARMTAQIDYLSNNTSSNHIVFLDYDMIVNKNLDSMFENDFDLALTYRDNKDQPINGGIFFIKNHGKEKAIQFLSDTLEIYKKKYSDNSFWWGDQMALRDMVNIDDYKDNIVKSTEVNGIRILLLPSEQYNYTPSINFRLLNYMNDKLILHFKGYNKKFMRIYYYLNISKNIRILFKSIFFLVNFFKIAYLRIVLLFKYYIKTQKNV